MVVIDEWESVGRINATTSAVIAIAAVTAIAITTQGREGFAGCPKDCGGQFPMGGWAAGP
ncbi:hypothetical protein MINTM006_52920 [Mycobacterium intracellulare]|nr:hypothetical protein MINTM006_52920 [Mycobacterium intracellulare]BCP23597.1 hypothetical protein MINTM023_53860 [Mycobacterium intracellulare]BCP34605.1 hypothetical protein MINTM026_55750 [Mycobacterium intracellulare]